MKKLVLIATVLVLAGCNDNRFSSNAERTSAAQEVIDNAQKVCQDHVEYLSFPNAYGRTFTPHLQVDGKPFGC